MPGQIFEVESPYPGRLSVCMRPRGDLWLEADVQRLGRSGWHVLVSALMPGEIADLQLAEVADHCRAAGLEYYPFPIGNLQVPPLDDGLTRLAELRRRLLEGRGVTAHCNGSIGRGPLIVASLLVLGGVPADEAWMRIADARGKQVPDTIEQRAWPSRLAGLVLPE